MQLGRVGIWQRRHEVSAHTAQEIEALGNTALWLGASPDPADARPFLQQTSTLIVATGILNVWQHEPTEVAALHAELTSAFPGRSCSASASATPRRPAPMRGPQF
jgi:alkanesulfonate monooxygenase SsuD/methylene tetrahydromethanopterin reductase-like flavin-dependent oxidoreductase (luciferase family)